MELLKTLENLQGLNGLDVGSHNYKEYFQIMQELERSHDNKKVKDADYSLGRLGLKLGVAITLNPSPMPPLESELKYAEEHRMEIKKCDDGHYKWFK